MTKTSHSKSYGLTLADAVKHVDFFLTEDDDLTLVAAQGLAMAYQAVAALGGESAPVELIKSCLERAWHALLYLRTKQPINDLDESIFTRYGRFRGVLGVKRPDLEVVVKDLETGDVNRPIYRSTVRKRKRRIKGK